MPQPTSHPAFDSFVATIAALRAPDGCPWDKEQTHSSIASNMIEEAYEAVDAIESGDIDHLREELGDVLLQVVLQSQIAADEGEFTIDDVCREIDGKIVHRHPHVFGDAAAGSAGEVLKQWEKIKLADRAQDDAPKGGILDTVPRALPALMEAQKISRKAVACGFEWDSLDAVWSQVDEEIGELKEAYEQAPKADDGTLERDVDPHAVHAVELELGDVLFALVNVARKMGLSAEECLRETNTKFRRRWASMEAAAAAQDRAISDYSTDELEALWAQAKQGEVS